jgi:hypothetical protein
MALAKSRLERAVPNQPWCWIEAPVGFKPRKSVTKNFPLYVVENVAQNTGVGEGSPENKARITFNSPKLM